MRFLSRAIGNLFFSCLPLFYIHLHTCQFYPDVPLLRSWATTRTNRPTPRHYSSPSSNRNCISSAVRTYVGRSRQRRCNVSISPFVSTFCGPSSGLFDLALGFLATTITQDTPAGLREYFFPGEQEHTSVGFTSIKTISASLNMQIQHFRRRSTILQTVPGVAGLSIAGVCTSHISFGGSRFSLEYVYFLKLRNYADRLSANDVSYGTLEFWILLLSHMLAVPYVALQLALV